MNIGDTIMLARIRARGGWKKEDRPMAFRKFVQTVGPAYEFAVEAQKINTRWIARIVTRGELGKSKEEWVRYAYCSMQKTRTAAAEAAYQKFHDCVTAETQEEAPCPNNN